MKEKCINIFNKTRYIWEFLFSLLLAIFSYQLINVKYYQGYWSKLYLLITALLCIITIVIIVYNCIKSKKQLEKIFLNFMIPIGLFYMIFMLPTYAPDESAHIWRAYEISEGNILTKQDENGNSLGVDIPKVLEEARHENLFKYSKLNELLGREVNYEDTSHYISAAQNYPFILYVPEAIIFFIARMCNISILLAIYVAKISNFIIFLLGGYYAIKKVPFGKYIIFTCLFLPMVLQQAVSLSADSIINTGLLVYIVYTMSLIFQKEKINRKQKIIYSLLIIFVALAKMAYIPLIGLGFLLIFSKNMTKKEKITIFGVGTLICFIIVIVNYMYSAQLSNPPMDQYLEESNVNGGEQIKSMLQNPMSLVKALTNTFGNLGQYYIYTMIGSPLGFLNIQVNPLIIMSFILLLLLSTIIEKNEITFSKWQKIWNLLIVIGTILIIVVGFYVSWTSVGGTQIEGVQGRYFIPVLPLLLLCISMKDNYIKLKHIHLILPIILTILNGFVINTLIHFFI